MAYGDIKEYPVRGEINFPRSANPTSDVKVAKANAEKLNAAFRAEGLTAMARAGGFAYTNMSASKCHLYATDYETWLDAARLAADMGLSVDYKITDQGEQTITDPEELMARHRGAPPKGYQKYPTRAAPPVAEGIRLTESRLRQIIREEVAALRRR